MKYIRTTFLGALAIVLVLYLSNYIGLFIQSYMEKLYSTIELTILGLLILMMFCCIIGISYCIGRLVQLFVKFKT